MKRIWAARGFQPLCSASSSSLDLAFAAKLRDTMTTAGPQLVRPLDEKSLIGLLFEPGSA